VVAASTLAAPSVEDVELWAGVVLVLALVVLLLWKERLAGVSEAGARGLSRRLNLALYPLLITYFGYVLFRLVQALR
jgi:hypothetical protein